MSDITFITFTEEDFYEGTPEEFPLLEELVPAEKDPLMKASEALKESQERLAFLENQARMAAQEAAILDEVREVNNLVRKTVVEMGDQRLLPRDMQQRRKATAADSDDIVKMFNDLGF